MSSIWVESEGAWKLLAPVGFPDERTLHRLVEDAPQLLPLAGSPRLLVLGHEVPVGGDPEGGFDESDFASGLADSLRAGRFRLVLVLDDSPGELVRVVGYLESIAPELVIDLVTVSAYDINGSIAL